MEEESETNLKFIIITCFFSFSLKVSLYDISVSVVFISGYRKTCALFSLTLQPLNDIMKP